MAMTTSEVLYKFVTSYSAPVIALYLVFVFLSPWLRKLFSPLELRRVLMVHNLVCSLLSFYCVCCFVVGFWQLEVWDFFSKERVTGFLKHGMLVYWGSKLYELLDTVLMVLRHRIRQVSVLHVFHHASITLLANWLYYNLPIPATVPLLIINSFIHVVMYGYYFLTALHPLHAFTWKKRITQLQLFQFVFGMAHGGIGYLYHGFCIYCVLYVVIMVFLFSNFYYQSYIRTNPAKQTSSKQKAD